MDLPLDWKVVKDAIQKVKSSKEADKRLQQHKLKIEREQNEAIAAIDKLKMSMDGLDGRNEEIAEDMAELRTQLDDQTASLIPLKIRWQTEDEEWQRRAAWRQQIRTAINEGHFKQSQFEKDFLQSKSMHHDNLRDEEIESYLRQSLLTAEKNRSQQLRTQWYKVRLHHKNLTHLLEKINKLKHLIEDRLNKAYADILKSLKVIGLKDDVLQDLHGKLKTLNQTLQECEVGLKECDKEIANGRRNLREFKNELKSFLKPFSDVIEGMHGKVSSLEREEQRLQKIVNEKQSDYERYETQIKGGMVIGGVAGAFVGAAAGSSVFPVVGTVMGAITGYVLAKTPESQLERKKRELDRERMKLDAKRSILRLFKTTEDKGKTEIKELKKLINELM